MVPCFPPAADFRQGSFPLEHPLADKQPMSRHTTPWLSRLLRQNSLYSQRPVVVTLFKKKYMLQRHSSQTLVLRTESGARATVTWSGSNQALQHAWKPATIHLGASEHVAIKHMCWSEYVLRSCNTFSLRVNVHLLGGNDASCSLHHLYHSAQLYSFSFIHFPSYLKGDDTQVNMSWQLKYKLSLNLKK